MTDNTTDSEKICSLCGNKYPANPQFFTKDKRNASGLGANCRDCQHKYTRRHYQNNREEILERTKAWHKANPEKVKESARKYRRNHPDRVKACDKKCKQIRMQRPEEREKAKQNTRLWRIKNPQRRKESMQRWVKNNPAKVRAGQHKYRARKRELPATFTAQDWQYALEYFHGCCAYCGNPPSLFDRFTVLQQEHFISVDNGGGYIPPNIIPGCQSCNLSKRHTPALDWLISKFGKRKANQIYKRIQDYFEEVAKRHG